MTKKILLTAISFFLSLGVVLAQAPNKFNYQGIARNTAGQALANQTLGLQLTIRTGSATGTTEFQETHTVTTNAYGLYKVEVGTGTNVSGSISAVSWATGSKYMQVEIDPAGGTNYTSLGNTELLSVPYALYAADGNPGPQGPAGQQGLQGPAGIPGATGPAGSANINGTAGKIIKFTGATTGGNSLINDNDTTVNIGGYFTPITGTNPKMSINSNSAPGLEIKETGFTPNIVLDHNNSSGSALTVDANGTGDIGIVSHSQNRNAIIASSNGTTSALDNSLSASIRAEQLGNGAAIHADKFNTKGFAGFFNSSYSAGVTDSGIVGIQYSGSVTNKDHIGLAVHVVPNPASNYGIGVKGTGGWYGVFGQSSHTGTAGNFGLYGFAKNSGGASYGVYGISYNNTGSSTGNKYGVYGRASGGANNYAAYFGQGNVQVSNMLSKGGGTFKIDHPLDPENKYLYHSFVESPDMMNIYNGNITTDAQGYATVTMPNYFNALNTDFRYQLTVMGTFAQAIIKEKINGNSFVIQTNQPNIEVSWQVTGVRQDKFANANRVQVEVEKPADEKGLYLHSEAWGQSKDKDMNYIIHQKPIEDKEAAGRE